MQFRIEKDNLGELEISDDVFWGIHTQRALLNFNISGRKTNPELIMSLALVKKACLIANQELGYIDDSIFNPIIEALNEISEGKHLEQFPIDAFQGGAGTSANMNINEVASNLAIERLGKIKGEYSIINPIEHLNLHQSTNDVYPTAVKISIINKLKKLSEFIAKLQGALNDKEKEFTNILTIGRTEMQDAVPITLGSQFASFAEAISRDRWRIFKNEERIRQVNIGGTAVGTGLTAPRKYIFLVIEKLRHIAGLGLSRADQIMDNTANLDAFVEISGMLKANAVNLKKIALDLRFLHYQKEIELPALQSGSSIMPGKVNPVIAEAVIQTATLINGNDSVISELCSMGTLQINEYFPMIANLMLENLDLLINLNQIFAKHIEGIKANEKICKLHFEENEIIITAFLPEIGYYECEKLINEFRNQSHKNVKEFLIQKFGEEKVTKILSPGNLMALGHR